MNAKFPKIKSVQLLLSVAAIIFAFAIAHYFIIFLPAKQKMDYELKDRELKIKEAEQVEKNNRQKVFDDCHLSARNRAGEILDKTIKVGEKVNYNVSEMKAAQEQGLVKSEDYDRFFDDCLKKNGIKY